MKTLASECRDKFHSGWTSEPKNRRSLAELSKLKPVMFDREQTLRAFSESLEKTFKNLALNNGVEQEPKADKPSTAFAHFGSTTEKFGALPDASGLKSSSLFCPEYTLDQMRLSERERDCDVLSIPGEENRASLEPSKQRLQGGTLNLDIDFNHRLSCSKLPESFREFCSGFPTLSIDADPLNEIHFKYQLIEYVVQSYKGLLDGEVNLLVKRERRPSNDLPVRRLFGLEKIYRTVLANHLCRDTTDSIGKVFNVFLGVRKLELIEFYVLEARNKVKDVVTKLQAKAPELLQLITSRSRESSCYFLSCILSDRLNLGLVNAPLLRPEDFGLSAEYCEVFSQLVENELLRDEGRHFFKCLAEWQPWQNCLVQHPKCGKRFKSLQHELYRLQNERLATFSEEGYSVCIEKLTKIARQFSSDKFEFYYRPAVQLYYEARVNYLLDRYGRVPTIDS